MVSFFLAAAQGEMRAAARATAIKAVVGLCLVFIFAFDLVGLGER
ncbi:MAG: hypothetical protein ACO3JG_01865 [Luteolibacter sp.]